MNKDKKNKFRPTNITLDAVPQPKEEEGGV
jgi:hypothetical protein